MRALAVLVLLMLAGCYAPGFDAPASLERAVGDDAAARTTSTVPQWASGEWWRYRVTDRYGFANETTRVVAGVDGEQYVVGMPLAEWNEDIIAGHLPGFGDVRRADLAFEVHDGMYKLLSFPLRAGDSWTAFFEWGNQTVNVTRVNATHAEIETGPIPDGRFAARALYDARVGEIVMLDIDGYGTVEVLDHGYGWEGTLWAPRAQSLIFVVGEAIAGLTKTNGPNPQPFDTVTVPAGTDRVALTLAVGTPRAGGQTPSPGGYFRERATAPDGTVYEREATTQRITWLTFGHNGTVGTWQFEHVSIGTGGAQTEGFAYQVHEIDLPTRAVRRPLAED